MDNSAYTKRADGNGRHANAPIHFDDAATERPDVPGKSAPTPIPRAVDGVTRSRPFPVR